MAIAKKTAAPAKAAKPASKTTKAETTSVTQDSVNLEPITVQRTFVEGGERNEDESEVIEHVAFPQGAKVAKVAVMVGTSEDYGAVKASVTVSVPAYIEELDEAAEFATAKAKEFLDAVSEAVGVDDAVEEAPKGKSGKAKPAKTEVTSSRKAGKNVKAEEPEDDDGDDDAGDDGEEIELFSDEELDDMDEDQLKEVCETWEIAWPKSKKASVRKAEAISAILEKQAEAAAEDDDDADGEAGEGDEVGPEDIEAMDRKQLEAWIEEYNEENPDDAIEVDLSEYPKNAKGLKTLKAELIEALFEDE